MSKTIAVLNQKGGAGKTTIATNLAHGLLLDGFRVLLVDADPQGSLRDWNEVNGGEVVSVVGLDRESLAKDLTAVSTGYDYVVIDGAPQIAKLSAAAVKAADLVLIPVGICCDCVDSGRDLGCYFSYLGLVLVVKGRHLVPHDKTNKKQKPPNDG